MVDDDMVYKEKDGTTLRITRWSERLYKVLWVAAILMIAFSICGVIFLGYVFLRFDNMNVLDKIGEIPMDLKSIEAAIRMGCG